MDEKEKEVLKLKIEVLETLLALRELEIQKLNLFIKENNVIEVVFKDGDNTFYNRTFRR